MQVIIQHFFNVNNISKIAVENVGQFSYISYSKRDWIASSILLEETSKKKKHVC